MHLGHRLIKGPGEAKTLRPRSRNAQIPAPSPKPGRNTVTVPRWRTSTWYEGQVGFPTARSARKINGSPNMNYRSRSVHRQRTHHQTATSGASTRATRLPHVGRTPSGRSTHSILPGFERPSIPRWFTASPAGTCAAAVQILSGSTELPVTSEAQLSADGRRPIIGGWDRSAGSHRPALKLSTPRLHRSLIRNFCEDGGPVAAWVDVLRFSIRTWTRRVCAILKPSIEQGRLENLGLRHRRRLRVLQFRCQSCS